MRTYVVVAEKAVPGADAPAWGKKKKRADANPPQGPQPGGTIDGDPADDTADPADPNENEPDNGAGADAQPFDQTQRPDPEPDDTVFAAADPHGADPHGADPHGADPQDKTDATTAEDQQPNPEQPTNEPSADAASGEHEWAGDLNDTGDETDPAQSFAGFTGQGGEQAWLDRADDGTLTGWVKDADGSIYRYSDADAWAIDVDDAGMTPQGGAAAQADPNAPQAPDQVGTATGQDPAVVDPMQTGMQTKSVKRVVRRSSIAAAPRSRLVRIGKGRRDTLQVTPLAR